MSYVMKTNIDNIKMPFRLIVKFIRYFVIGLFSTIFFVFDNLKGFTYYLFIGIWSIIKNFIFSYRFIIYILGFAILGFKFLIIDLPSKLFKKKDSFYEVGTISTMENAKKGTKYVFTYKIRDKANKVKNGSLNAYSKEDAIKFLNNEANKIIYIRNNHGIVVYLGATKNNNKEISINDLIYLLESINIYLKSGNKINEAIHAINGVVGNKKKLRVIVKYLDFQINKGESFADAISNMANLFHKDFVSMASLINDSNINSMIHDILNYYHDINTTKKILKNSIITPISLMLFVLSIMFISLFFVRFRDGLNSFNTVILNICNFITHNFVLIAFIIFMLYLTNYVFKGVSYKYKINKERVFFHIPLIGKALYTYETLVYGDVMYLIMNNNIPSSDVGDLIKSVTNNAEFRTIYKRTLNNFDTDKSLEYGIRNKVYHNNRFLNMLKISSSNNEEVIGFQKINIYYENEFRKVVDLIKYYLIYFITLLIIVITLYLLVVFILPRMGLL